MYIDVKIGELNLAPTTRARNKEINVINSH